MLDGKILTISFESSCHETSVAFVLNGREVLSNIISSQIDIHKEFGGVVPEIASRHHLNNINRVAEKARDQASEKYGRTITWKDIDVVGVTKGPGLVGALLIGIATAKAFAAALDRPLVGVHHIHGHISANYIEHEDLEPPFTALVVSGGHTSLVRSDDYDSFAVIGETRDDAAGEAYDKVARVLGLGYPGGPLIDETAKKGDPGAVEFKRVFLEKGSYDFSFSGIKTGVLNYVNSEKQAGRWDTSQISDVAAGFQQAVLDVILTKTIAAVKENSGTMGRKLAVAGGVAANSRLREMLACECEKENIRLYIPSPVLCTDNAAMIGCAAYYRYRAGKTDGLSMDAYASIHI